MLGIDWGSFDKYGLFQIGNGVMFDRSMFSEFSPGKFSIDQNAIERLRLTFMRRVSGSGWHGRQWIMTSFSRSSTGHPNPNGKNTSTTARNELMDQWPMSHEAATTRHISGSPGSARGFQ